MAKGNIWLLSLSQIKLTNKSVATGQRFTLHRLQPVAPATVVAEIRRQVGPLQGPTTFPVVTYLFPFKEVTGANDGSSAQLERPCVVARSAKKNLKNLTVY